MIPTIPVSRLRLQLAAWFALVFLVGLGAVDFALFTYLRGEADRNLTRELNATADGVVRAVQRELLETPDSLPFAAHEALNEWPDDSNGFVIFNAAGTRIATRGAGRLTRLVPPYQHLPSTIRSAWDVPLDAEGDLRLTVARSAARPAFAVVALLPTTNLREAGEGLALWLALSAPLVMLLAVAGGYVLARRALRPLRAMTEEIKAIDPRDLDRRLPVRDPPDELDSLAEQFNGLFERLAQAQAQSRRFLAQAAHQIRTPLTVIRGESGLGLDRPRSVEEHRDLLRRIALAAEQMTHRVDDLFLLAQAEAGDRPALTDQVDVDGLVLECVDLMRGRAGALGRQLELATMDPAEVRGNESLIREGVLELLENACRHGDSGTVIRVATLNGDSTARIEVSSGGPLVSPASLEGHGGRAGADRIGLGLSIVRWIASVHGGELWYRHEPGVNVFALSLAAPRGA